MNYLQNPLNGLIKQSPLTKYPIVGDGSNTPLTIAPPTNPTPGTSYYLIYTDGVFSWEEIIL